MCDLVARTYTAVLIQVPQDLPYTPENETERSIRIIMN